MDRQLSRDLAMNLWATWADVVESGGASSPSSYEALLHPVMGRSETLDIRRSFPVRLLRRVV